MRKDLGPGACCCGHSSGELCCHCPIQEVHASLSPSAVTISDRKVTCMYIRYRWKALRIVVVSSGSWIMTSMRHWLLTCVGLGKSVIVS
jgi:hypothetical protein